MDDATAEADELIPAADARGEQPTLFPLPPPCPVAARVVGENPKEGARLREAERSQISWGPIDLGATLVEDHPARLIWAVVERLDLSSLYAQIEARDEVAGAPAIDPKILLALWIYATSEGEGIRAITLFDGRRNRLCEGRCALLVTCRSGARQQGRGSCFRFPCFPESLRSGGKETATGQR